MKNNFITLEGGEGVGKSTAMAFIKKYFAGGKKRNLQIVFIDIEFIVTVQQMFGNHTII